MYNSLWKYSKLKFENKWFAVTFNKPIKTCVKADISLQCTMAEIFGTDVTAHYQAQFGRDIQFSTGNATIHMHIENFILESDIFPVII